MNKDLNIDKRIEDLIIKSLERQITPEEEKELHAWISREGENKRYFIEMQYLWNTSGVKDKTVFNKEVAFERFKERIEKSTKLQSRNKSFYLYPILKYAAVILLAFVLGGLSYYFINNHNFQNASQQYAITVPNGSKTKIVLPDGSKVWLNAGSTLHFNKNFGVKNRDIELNGEGYFEVVHNSKKPFIVHANEASIRDLGTKFNVMAYSDDKNLSITLLKGSIQLTTIYNPKKILRVKPNQSVIINKSRKDLMVKQVVARDAAAWTKGEIIFNEETFGNIVRTLERDYNVKIIVEDSNLNKLRFFGDFKNNQSIGEILNIMTASHEFHYKMKDNLITVYR